MRFFRRMFVCLAAALLLSALLIHSAVSSSGERTDVLRLGRLLVFEARRSQALDSCADTVMRSMDVKRDITDQLVAGRLPLSEAIDHFCTANEMIDNDTRLVATYQLPADREGVAQQVLVWVYHTVDSWPDDKAQRLLADLESEYQKMFGRPSSLDPAQSADPLPPACCAG